MLSFCLFELALKNYQTLIYYVEILHLSTFINTFIDYIVNIIVTISVPEVTVNG